jgi:hypothetical protein
LYIWLIQISQRVIQKRVANGGHGNGAIEFGEQCMLVEQFFQPSYWPFPWPAHGACRRYQCTTLLVAYSTRPSRDGAFEALLLTKTDRGLRKRLPFLDTLVASAIAGRVFNQCSLMELNSSQIHRENRQPVHAAQQNAQQLTLNW